MTEWAKALVYAGELLVKGTRAVALTIESVTALRNLRAAQPDEDEHPQSAREEGASPPPPRQQGTAQETQGNRHKKQRVNPRPDRKRGREDAGAGGVGDLWGMPRHTATLHKRRARGRAGEGEPDLATPHSTGRIGSGSTR